MRCGTGASVMKTSVINPAFDVTPARLVTSFVADRGVIRPPHRRAIRQFLAR
jgi:methylthioribose-1-phosphate isomerase